MFAHLDRFDDDYSARIIEITTPPQITGTGQWSVTHLWCASRSTGLWKVAKATHTYIFQVYTDAQYF